MNFLIKGLTLSLVFYTFYASAESVTNAFAISEGIYNGKSSQNRACSVEIKTKSKFWQTHILTVYEESLNAQVMPDITVESEPFSLKEMQRQIMENDGKFLITKKTSTKTNKFYGRVFEQNGSLFWDVTVSREACFGFCTSSTASCSVQIQF